MDTLDEKANGGPSMEIDEIVSVRNRLYSSVLVLSLNLILLFTDEAFAAKHMPDLGQDIKDFQVFTWRLENWKKLDKKLTSQEFECGGHKWCARSSFARPCY